MTLNINVVLHNQNVIYKKIGPYGLSSIFDNKPVKYLHPMILNITKHICTLDDKDTILQYFDTMKQILKIHNPIKVKSEVKKNVIECIEQHIYNLVNVRHAAKYVTLLRQLKRLEKIIKDNKYIY